MPRERGEKVVATNRNARHDYLIEDTYEAGMVLSGTEVKSARDGQVQLGPRNRHGRPEAHGRNDL